MQLFLYLSYIGLYSAVAAKIKFASYYGDHMVLQRGPQRANVWGTATSVGDTVHVDLVGTKQKLRLSTNVVKSGNKDIGFWKVKLPAVVETSQFNLSVSSSEGQVAIHDVLFGDVWICSGQSNMQFSMRNIFNSSLELIKSLTFKNIRVFRTSWKESLEPLDDIAAVATQWSLPTNKSIPAFSAVCWMYAQYIFPTLNYPLGLVESATDSSPIEAWSSPDALKKCPRSDFKMKSILWNSMIYPLLRMTIYGALWYQGERNVNRALNYACQFPALIDDWRNKFHSGSQGETDLHFPFGFVQLAASEKDSAHVGGFPDLRWSQTANTGHVPNTQMYKTFMAVAMDLPDYNSPFLPIHPRDKKDVGLRLTLSGRAIAYNDNAVEHEGPFPSSYKKDAIKRGIEITYNEGRMPIEVRSETGFEVCCNENVIRCSNDTEWRSAPIEYKTETSVAIGYDVCMGISPSGVRYAWRESPCEFKLCPVYGAESGLPAPPFIKLTRF